MISAPSSSIVWDRIESSNGARNGCEIGTGPGCTVTANALYYDPETITSYEAGLKTRLVGNALRMNLSAFHYDFKGIQLNQLSQLSQLSTICGGPCQVTTNAGKAKVDGVELETVANPGPNTRFDASASWLNARYTDFFPTPTVSFAARKFDRSPEWTVTAGIMQTIPLAGGGDIQAAARTRYRRASPRRSRSYFRSHRRCERQRGGRGRYRL